MKADENKKIKIFICHTPNKRTRNIDSNEIFTNICGGAVFDDGTNNDILGDNTGDSISVKNKSYCELSVVYWMWKNVEAEYYGLCHYRRFFNFGWRNLTVSNHGQIVFNYLDDKAKKTLNLLNNKAIERAIKGYDIILASPDRVTQHGHRSLIDQYSSSETLNVSDLMNMMDIVADNYPDMVTTMKAYMNGELFYPCNLFIMKKDIFNKYCCFLFDVLKKFEKASDLSKYSKESYRVIGHLGERLLGIFSLYMMNKYKCNFKTLQSSIILNCENFIFPKPSFIQNNIPIVTLCREVFVPILCVFIESLILSVDNESKYDILILYDELLKPSQELMEGIIKNINNINLQFVDVNQYKSKLNLYDNDHVPAMTFYRFLLPEICVNYEKVIWLDGDIIVKRDLRELFEINFENNYIIATLDADAIGNYNEKKNDLKKYFNNFLDEPYKYSQAGVMIWNLQKMREDKISDKMVKLSHERKYHYGDQDIINKACQGRIKICDMKWNVLTTNMGRRQQVINKAPLYISEAYTNARKNPYIIHYAGSIKPWDNPDEDYAYEWWAVARSSIMYEYLLINSSNQSKHDDKKNNISKNQRLSRYEKFSRKYPADGKIRTLSNRLFPRGSLRRRIAVWLYFGSR